MLIENDDLFGLIVVFNFWDIMWEDWLVCDVGKLWIEKWWFVEVDVICVEGFNFLVFCYCFNLVEVVEYVDLWELLCELCDEIVVILEEINVLIV